MLSHLSHIRAWGGNFLLNIGPKPDGTLPDEVLERFDELQEWMSKHRQAVTGVESNDDYRDYSTVPVTKSGDIWYLHLLPDYTGSVTVEGMSRPVSVRLLRNGQDQGFEWNDKTRRFTLVRSATWSKETVEIVEIRNNAAFLKGDVR
jgi:alpha-L-fucosidase